MTTDLRDQLHAALGSSYTLERELGGGGMSRVFVAQETALGRRVVIKVLPPELAADVNAERFRREIDTARILPLIPARLVDAQFLAGTHKRLGELYEATGDREKALSHYVQFVELWKNADPELQGKVAQVRQRLARLRVVERR